MFKEAARYAAVLTALAAFEVRAETITPQGPADGTTPPALAPGAPVGSYPLSGIEQINIFNGHLNVRVPLLEIGGRGQARVRLFATIDAPKWTMETSTRVIERNGSGAVDYQHSTSVVQETWRTYDAGYGPGILVMKRTGEGTATDGLGQPKDSEFGTTFTYLTFLQPDGGELALYAKANGGPKSNNLAQGPYEPCRGAEFVSTDGSGATFLSTAAICDVPEISAYPQRSEELPSGKLYFPDGTRYEILNGMVTWIRDRNGNLIQFEHTGNRVSAITDAAGRVVTVTYSANQDEISFPGSDGATRTIAIVRALPKDQLRPGMTNPESLFPQAGVSILGPSKRITKIVLPDERYYEFFYTPYGEVARIQLPTGGRIDYEYGRGIAGSASGVYDSGQVLDALPGIWNVTSGAVPPAPWRPFIYRRLLERREYPDAENLKQTQTLARPETVTDSVSDPQTNKIRGVVLSLEPSVDTTRTAADVPGPTVERHYFHSVPRGFPSIETGGPAASLQEVNMRYTPDPFEGKEYKTEIAGLQRIETVYRNVNGAGMPCQQNTTWIAQNQGSGKVFLYDRDASGNAVSPAFGNRTDVYEYASAPAIVVNGNSMECPATVPAGHNRRTHTDYLLDAAYTVNAGSNGELRHLRNLATLEQVYAGSTLVSQVRTTYDNQSSPACTLPYRLEDSGAGMQVDGHYTTALTERGNVRCVARWLDTTGEWVATGAIYDTAGNVIERYDERKRDASQWTSKTSIDYTDHFKAGTGAPVAATKSFPTTITHPLGHEVRLQYDYGTGKVTQCTDANGAVTTYGYSGDLLDRLKTVQLPVGSREFVYDDANRVITAKTRLASSPTEKWKESRTRYDGFGRTIRQEESGGATTIYVDRTYDGYGRLATVSNPHEGTSSGTTATSYDGLDRLVKVTHADNSVDRTCYAGREAVVRDAAGKWKKLVRDGLGRLVQVVEDATGSCDGLNYTGTNVSTQYAYDGLDRLKVVCQQGSLDAAGECTGAQKQARTFAYDSLGRLTQAENPEMSAVSYTYDTAGNLVTKAHAGGPATCFGTWSGGSCNSTGGYDALNRVLKKSYSDGTPAVTFVYDTCANGKGRVCSVVNAEATRSYAYNSMGWVSSSSQTMGLAAYNFNPYEYDEAGELTKVTYPSGRVVEYERDALGRVSKVKSGATEYASLVQYAPHGGITVLGLGSQREQRCYNSRLQVSHVRVGSGVTAGCAAGSGEVLRLEYGYGSGANNGNVASQRMVAGSLDVTQGYQYDGLNRVTQVTEGAEFRGYGYSEVGNLWVSGTSAGMGMAAGVAYPNGPGWIDPLTNRLKNVAAGVRYEEATGNLTSIGGQGFAYDGEGRLKSSTVNGVTTEYGYDGEGRRVRRGAVVYVYDAAGELAAEYGGAGGDGVRYVGADGLGSTRVVLDGAGVVKERYDYYPFGDMIPAGVNGRTVGMGYEEGETGGGVAQRFTGKERDGETGLDYFGARYFSGAQGRFTSPDAPFADQHPEDPQSWNLYSYTRNNPLKYIDDDGRATIVATWGREIERAAPKLGPWGRYVAVAGTAMVAADAAWENRREIGKAMGSVRDTEIESAWIQQQSNRGDQAAPQPQQADQSTPGDPNDNRPFAKTPENRERMSQGKAPVGKDGKAVELHHDGQQQDSPLKPMTRSEHRGAGNFKKNHQNTGQRPTQIDRAKFRKQQREYWKKENESENQ